ncbi:MAG: HAMP domain-containing histidine kinase [Bacteroidales bacterium]|nr:HAMP domain-containing histidine kinase [Bacteroidales bacterium]
MSRKVIILVIVLTSVSLIAAIITQLLWVRDAWQLKEDQFTSRVHIAMKSVVNQLLTSDAFPSADTENYQPDFYLEHENLLIVVNPYILDSLLKYEMNAMRIENIYQYGVYREEDSVWVMGSPGADDKKIKESDDWVSLSCLCEEHSYLLGVYFPDKKSMILSDMIILPVMSGLFLMVLVFSFLFTIYSLIRQKKLSEMKTDFVNNMTHEFKTPISTISVSSEMLSQDQITDFPDRVKKYARIIYDENLRLKNLVDRVLQIATLEKGEVKLRLETFELHKLIHETINNYLVQHNDNPLVINQHLNAKPDIVLADRIHVYNVVINLIDNAYKYSPKHPEINVFTRIDDEMICIDVTDNGIGISKENQPQVFKKFHRIQSGDIHDVKGFGIGLFYVKTILESMGGSITLKSEKNKGSTFTVKLPQPTG